MPVFGAPSRYIQAPGIIGEMGNLTRDLGKRALLVADKQVAAMLLPSLTASLSSVGASLNAVSFDGEITEQCVTGLATRAKESGCDFVIAAGGGKGIDAGKATAHRLDVAVVTLPTAASTDSPTSRIYVLYDDAHRMVSVCSMERNPECVIVDTQILAAAPRHLLQYGLGDAISKKFEVRQAVRSNGSNLFGSQATKAAEGLAEVCHNVLRENAESALSVAGTGKPTPEFEQVVEATTLLAGLAFENGGLSVAHALTRGIPRLRGLANTPHGLQIPVALMVQLKLEAESAQEHAEMWNWLPRLGLPRSFQELGATLDEDDPQWVLAAEATLAAPHARNFERCLGIDELVHAMKNPAPTSFRNDMSVR